MVGRKRPHCWEQQSVFLRQDVLEARHWVASTLASGKAMALAPATKARRAMVLREKRMLGCGWIKDEYLREDVFLGILAWPLLLYTFLPADVGGSLCYEMTGIGNSALSWSLTSAALNMSLAGSSGRRGWREISKGITWCIHIVEMSLYRSSRWCWTFHQVPCLMVCRKIVALVEHVNTATNYPPRWSVPVVEIEADRTLHVFTYE